MAPPSARLALLLVAVALVFAPGFWNGATSFDDDALVFENPAQADFGWRELGEVLDPRAPRMMYGRQYTPLSDLSYQLDRRVFGTRPGPYHLQPLLFHLAAVAALVLLLRTLGGDERTALVAGAIFGLHPLSVEAVTWISGRRTAMAGAFMILAMLAWARARGRSPARGAYAASIALAVLANLSKQSAVVTALLLALTEWAMRRRDENENENENEGGARSGRAWRIALAYAPHVAIMIGFVALGVWVGRREGVVGDAARFPEELRGPVGRLWLLLAALASYARLMTWPADLQPMYAGGAPRGWADPGVAAGFAIVGLAGGAVALAWRRAPLLVFGVGLAAISLAPGLFTVGSQFVADRYAYPAIAGAGLVAALGLGRLGRASPAVGAAATGGLLLALALATVLRVGDWRDDLTLFRRAVASDPTNGVSRRMLGKALARAGRLEEAEAELRRSAALALADRFFGARLLNRALSDLGRVCEARGDLPEAENAFRTAVAQALGDDLDEPAQALARFYLRRGQRDRARQVYVDAIGADRGGAPRCRRGLAAIEGGQQGPGD